jgi:hypothetical protein
MKKMGYNQGKHPLSMKGVTDNNKFGTPLEGNAFGGKMAEYKSKGMSTEAAAKQAARDLKDMPVDNRASNPVSNLNKGYGSQIKKPAVGKSSAVPNLNKGYGSKIGKPANSKK